MGSVCSSESAFDRGVRLHRLPRRADDGVAFFDDEPWSRLAT
jgi:hypothetical protein